MIASINRMLQVDEDECELDIDSINWLIQMLLSFDRAIQVLQEDNQRLNTAVNVLLEKIRITQREDET